MSKSTTIQSLKSKNLIISEVISGSRAYGLHIPTSDTDIKGIFVLPKKEYYALEPVRQINNPSNDIVYYEIGRFMELLAVNNPNILEMLNTPKDSILIQDPLMSYIDPTRILSKKCKDTFGKFALSQIKKAKGLNKKIINPVDKERKKPLDFCYVTYLQGALPLQEFLQDKNWQQEECGLVKIPHMKDTFGLYHTIQQHYQGIIRGNNSNDICLSEVPKNASQVAILHFNKDGYSRYCKDYRDYWEWVSSRNEQRYKDTQSHGKNYDAKNMMHTFRLLHMAIEIAKEKTVNVRRPDRDFLLSIRSGKYDYDTLVKMAKERQEEMEEAFEKSDLPLMPDIDYIEQVMHDVREAFYQTH